jgi:ABC-2 type transport system permease protein
MNLSPDEVLNNSIQEPGIRLYIGHKKITSGGKQRIGFTEGHNELTDLQLNDAMHSLSDGYLVGRVNLTSIPLIALLK